MHKGQQTAGRIPFMTGVEWQLTLLLCVAVIVGGGGTYTGLANLLVQLCALGLLGVNLHLVGHFWRKVHWGFRALLCATLALPLLQVMPLPPVFWSSLPGRDPLVESYGLLGVTLPWRALSVTPARSFLAFLSLIPPLTVLVLSTALDRAQRERLLMVVVGLGLFQFALGVLQVLTQNRAGNVFGGYGYIVPSQMYGTFANHNATGMYLVLALCALSGLPLLHRRMSGVVLHAMVAVILFLGVVLTQSRSSMLLLFVPVALGFWRVFRESDYVVGLFRASLWKRLAALLVLVAVVAGGTWWLSQAGRISSSLSRFEQTGDARPGVWRDTLVAIDQFWPVGSGVGTFADVIQLSETLENVSEFRINRAHNEYLEVVLESGVAGGLLVAAWVILFATLSLPRRIIRSRVHLAAVGGGLCIALQCGVDYPFRTGAIFSIGAFFLSVLMVPRRASATDSENTVD